LEHGAKFTINLVNGSDRDVFITILALSSDGSVGQVFPHPDAAGAELLPRNESKSLPFPVYVPPGRSSVRDHIKVFVSTTPLDLRFLTQPAVRGRDAAEASADSPLERMLAQASVGATRNLGQPINLGDWAVLQQAFVVRKRSN
jgi:hypothetical protein